MYIICTATPSILGSGLHSAVVARWLNQLYQGAVLAQIIALTEQHLCELEHPTAGVRMCPAVLDFLE